MIKHEAQSYVVLYRDEKIMCPTDPPFAFRCIATDIEHAEEQCLDLVPGVDIVWSKQSESVDAVIADYWDTIEGPDEA